MPITLILLMTYIAAGMVGVIGVGKKIRILKIAAVGLLAVGVVITGALVFGVNNM